MKFRFVEGGIIIAYYPYIRGIAKSYLIKLTLQNIAYSALIITVVIALLVVARTILIPIAFAIIIAFALSPFANWFEKKGVGHGFSVFLTLFLVTIVIAGIITVFSFTFASIIKEFPEIKVEIDKGISTIEYFINDLLNLSDRAIENELEDNSSKLLNPLWEFVENSISSSFLAVGNIFLGALYVIFFLLYRKGLRRIILNNLKGKKLNESSQLLQKIRDVIQSYLLGLFVVILILGTANSIGLWIIGIDHAIFWGYLAGLLVVIPYIGTTIGGLLPFLYALATTDTLWQPVAIVIMYFTFQQLEGNFVTPKIVGSKIEVNPFFVINAMIIGGFIWGVAGLILAVPTIGIVHTILKHYEQTRHLGFLLSNKISKADFDYKNEL
ncbi:MAG: AI-2E family transporter [Crocinitomicaceae bacterium]|nr:AI-2E family transporter [Crocinitomicaceae bacterium]